MRAEKYIFLKEIEKATVNSGRNHPEKKSNAHSEECPRREARTLRVGRYHKFTPLNVSLANLYREVGKVERFSKLKALRIRANINRSLFYKYHNSFKHETEEYYDLQDAVE